MADNTGTGNKVVLASRNQAKLRELARILAQASPQVQLAGLDAFPGAPEVPETGATFEANALLKARAIAAHTRLPAVADDSGLCVDALNGMPGVLSARWAGGHGDDQANLNLVLAQLADVPEIRLGARFVCAAALVVPGLAPDGAAREWVVTGQVEGRLTRLPRGTGGFGYDPIFIPAGFDLTTAEMTADAKDAISHRGRAFRALTPVITAQLTGLDRSRPLAQALPLGPLPMAWRLAVFSYNERRFRPEGETGPVVTYRQDGDLLWAEIPAGGGVRRGALTGRCAPDGALDFAYTMVLEDGEVVCGRCHSTPLRRPGGGGIRIREEWERYGPNAATGVSYLEEVDAQSAT